MNSKDKINEIKYERNGRKPLLLLWILSIVNIVFIFALDRYFIFSVYLVNILAAVGKLYYVGTGEIAYIIVFIILSLLVTAVYFVCWLMSKKNYGWLIAALVIFCIDTLLMVAMNIFTLASGDFEGIYVLIFDLVFHVLAIVDLAIGVKYGRAAKIDGLPQEPDSVFSGEANSFEEGAQTRENTETGGERSYYSDYKRKVTLQRAKSFVGCAVAIFVYIDGKEVAKLKNGEVSDITVSGEPHELMCAFKSTGAESNIVTIPEGDTPLKYSVKINAGFTKASVQITEESNANSSVY